MTNLPVQQTARRNAQPSREEATALESSRRWLESWDRRTPPTAQEASDLKVALRYSDRRLAPTTAKEFAAVVDRIFQFAETWKIDVSNAQVATAFYRQALKDLPPDMLVTAIDRALAQHEGYTRLPLPAEIYRQAGDEYAKLNTERYRMAFALKTVGQHAVG
jgi:hypothetical protein